MRLPCSLLIYCLACLSWSGRGELRITNARIDDTGRIAIHFRTDQSGPVVLWRGETIAAIATPIATNLLAAGEGVLFDRRTSASQVFYRTALLPTVSGRVTLRGSPPGEQRLPLEESPACLELEPALNTTRLYQMGMNGGLGDVVVFVRAPIPGSVWPVPAEPLRIQYEGCSLHPYIQAGRAGQTIRVTNLDSRVLHILHPTPATPGNMESSAALLAGSLSHGLRFDYPEHFLRIKCDVHRWEFAYVSLFQHPFFAVTDANGQFALPPGLPPGEYTIEARHRLAGSATDSVFVDGRRPVTLDFELSVP